MYRGIATLFFTRLTFCILLQYIPIHYITGLVMFDKTMPILCTKYSWGGDVHLIKAWSAQKWNGTFCIIKANCWVQIKTREFGHSGKNCRIDHISSKFCYSQLGTIAWSQCNNITHQQNYENTKPSILVYMNITSVNPGNSKPLLDKR